MSDESDALYESAERWQSVLARCDDESADVVPVRNLNSGRVHLAWPPMDWEGYVVMGAPFMGTPEIETICATYLHGRVVVRMQDGTKIGCPACKRIAAREGLTWVTPS